jgi:hypothetical protein
MSVVVAVNGPGVRARGKSWDVFATNYWVKTTSERITICHFRATVYQRAAPRFFLAPRPESGIVDE